MTNPAPKLFSRRNAPDGFIVVAVLWILGALATLASIYAVYVIDTATAFAVHDDRLQAQALVSASLELTAHQVTALPQKRPSSGAFGFRMGRANVSVQYRSESARIDLNNASKELLAGFFAALGASREAEFYADRIIGWRNAPGDGEDRETSVYRTAGRRYGPRGAPFPHVGELGLVFGLPEVLVERALPLVTVYSGGGKVNVMDAAPEVIAALPGMTPDLLHTVLVQRTATPQNGEILMSLLGPAQGDATVEASRAMRVTVSVSFDNGRRTAAEAVIYIGDNDAEPYRVLSWRDEFDEALIP